MVLIILALALVVASSISTGIGEPNIPPSSTVLVATLILAVVFGVLLQDFRFSKSYQRIFDVITLGVISIFSVHIFLAPSIPLTHDLHFAHFPAMAVTKLRSGAGLIPRWTHLLWCGIPFSRVYSPLIFMISSALAWLNPADTAKLVFLIAYFLSALTAYFSNKKLFKSRTVGLVAAICYLLFGYHLIDSNVRGNPPETFAFVWTPLIFFFATRIMSESVPSKRLAWASLCSTSIAMIFWTHLLSGFITVVWIAFLPLVNLMRKDLTRREKIIASTVLVLAILFGLFLSAWILYPVVFEKNLFLVGEYNTGFWTITNHFVKLENFFIRKTWYERWISSPQWPMYLGNSILFLALSAIFFRSKKAPQVKMVLTFLTVTTIGCIAVSSDLATPLGEALVESNNPVLSVVTYLQFPWRSLLLCAFSASSLAGYTVGSMLSQITPSPRSKTFKKLALSIVILLILVDMFPYTGVVNQTAVEPPQELVLAVEWMSKQEGIFRVYYCGHDFQNPYWYLCGAGYAIPTLPPGGAFREWSPTLSNTIINSALDELNHARPLVYSGYLSIKYVVTLRSDLNKWLSGSSIQVVKYLSKYVILENILFKPFIEIATDKGKGPSSSIPSSVAIRRFDPENVVFDTSFDGSGWYYAIVKESYFSAWSATVNGTPTQVEPTEDGLMAVYIQAGSSTISLDLGYTPVERIGRTISLVAAVGIAFVLLATILDSRLSISHERPAFILDGRTKVLTCLSPSQ